MILQDLSNLCVLQSLCSPNCSRSVVFKRKTIFSILFEPELTHRKKNEPKINSLRVNNDAYHVKRVSTMNVMAVNNIFSLSLWLSAEKHTNISACTYISTLMLVFKLDIRKQMSLATEKTEQSKKKAKYIRKKHSFEEDLNCWHTHVSNYLVMIAMATAA